MTVRVSYDTVFNYYQIGSFVLLDMANGCENEQLGVSEPTGILLHSVFVCHKCQDFLSFFLLLEFHRSWRETG